MKNLYIFLFLLLGIVSFGQNHIVADFVKKTFQENNEIKIINKLTNLDANFKDLNSEKIVSNALYLDVNKVLVDELIKNNAPITSIKLDGNNNESFILDLVNSSKIFSELKISTASKKSFDFSNINAVFYQGVVRGQENSSIVSISIFENEIIGFISTSKGNFVLGKLKDSDKHILYKDSALLVNENFSCNTISEALTKEEELIYSNSTVDNYALIDKCVHIYYETRYDLFIDKGSVANVVSYVTALHNQVATLYLNEGIITPLTQLFVWDIVDVYNNLSPLLNQFSSNALPSNCNIGQLLSVIPSGSAAYGQAWQNGVCWPLIPSNLDYRKGISQIYPSFNNIPVYSWTVNVVAHEFGHLLGSRHTHDCFWNGNFTAIDGCNPSGFGSCPLGPIPAIGGTIMSYCQNNLVGVNLALGFGSQPGNVIRARVTAVNCLLPCGNCLLDLTTSLNISTTINEERSDWIKTTDNLAATARVIYHAGNYVELNPGFETTLSSQFSAYIQGCSGNFTYKNVTNNVSDEGNSFEIINKKINIYPNPTNSYFTVGYTNEKFNNVRITSLEGRVIFNQKIQATNSYQLDISNFKNGIYTVSIETLEGTVITDKLIKK